MSRDNRDLYLLMYEAFNRRDLDAVLALMHDEAVIEPRLGALDGDFRGHEGVRRWWSNLLGVLPDYAADVEALDDLGGVTLARIRGAAHGAASATPVVETWWQLVQWSNGKCIRWRNFATEDEALAAVGLWLQGP
jgi:ketosteroid isomerase-like protein